MTASTTGGNTEMICRLAVRSQNEIVSDKIEAIRATQLEILDASTTPARDREVRALRSKLAAACLTYEASVAARNAGDERRRALSRLAKLALILRVPSNSAVAALRHAVISCPLAKRPEVGRVLDLLPADRTEPSAILAAFETYAALTKPRTHERAEICRGDHVPNQREKEKEPMTTKTNTNLNMPTAKPVEMHAARDELLAVEADDRLGLSAREMAMCRAKGVLPSRYLAAKQRVVTRSRATR